MLKKKRYLSIIMALVMVIAILPMNVFANEVNEPVEQTPETTEIVSEDKTPVVTEGENDENDPLDVTEEEANPETLSDRGATVTGVAIISKPDKTVYTVGEALELAGLKVRLTYSDNHTDDVAFADFAGHAPVITTSPADGTIVNTPSIITVTVTCNLQTATFQVTVKAPAPATVTGIAKKTDPDKTVYTKGEVLDLTGLEATLTYSNGDTEDVDSAVFASHNPVITTSPAPGSVLNTVGNQDVTVACNGKTFNFQVTVNAPVPGTVTGIAIKTNPTKMVYNVGDKLKLNGLEVTLTKEGQPAEDVAFADFAAHAPVITTEPADDTVLDTAGIKTVKVKCNGFVATFNVEVKALVTPRVLSADVYYDKVKGTAQPVGATVKLYKNGVVLGSGIVDSLGNYSIAYNFGYYNGYYGGYYGYYGNVINPTNVGHTSLSGYTTANTHVVAYDGNGNYLGSTTSSSTGYYYISYSYVSNYNAITVYKGYYDGYYGGYYGYYGKYSDKYYGYYYDLSDYYLQAEKDGEASEKFWLNNAYAHNYWNGYWNGYYPGYWNGYYSNAKYATVTDAKAGNSYVKGYGVNPYATVTVKDSLGYNLGSSTADGNGYFTTYTNRALKYGETLTIITSINNYKDVSTTYVVGGSTSSYSYNYKNEFVIGSGKLVKTVDGITTIQYMDVAPYIKDGRTMLPLRYVAESLGYTVSWNASTRIATFTDGTHIILVSIDSSKFYIDGKAYNFSVKPEIKNGRTMLPISEVGKALGLSHGNKGEGKNIEWDAATQTVVIQKNK
ncbi:stalk domain-containing protein [Peptoniphilus sp. oral taxon 386]|uniref:stalk domain-containing protein n=1 Tax=Peptoniphilus sp. oral taxon 386 TaxID=652713 RepID=UPI0001DA9D0D|nr:stalk domain-containing protein [Peptoniphilus sp. oral taxon 386]EFI42485.1 copper amine oxidase domain protein [Peptoniphilus sp. oral taxon 386 str. F0131]